MNTQSRFTKVAIAAGLVVSSGAAVLGLTGFASAELAGRNDEAAVVVPAAGDNSTDNSTDSSTGTATEDSAAGTASAQAVDGAAPAAGDTHTHGPRTPFRAANVAKALGMTEADLRTALQTKTFATIAKEKNVDIADVKKALIADLKAHLDAEVASGEHTQAEADAKLAAFTTNIDTFVESVRPGKGTGGHGAPRFVTEGLAGVLKLTVADLNTQLQSGKTLADIAKAQDVSIDKVKDQLVADYTAKEQAEVASGEHTQAEVDAKIAEFKTRLDDMVNGVRPAGGDHGPRGGAPFATEDLAKVMGLSLTDLNTQLQSGKSLADIAKAQNVDIQKVKDQLVADFTAKEQAEVASGKHTQAEVDAKIAEFKTRLDDMVNGVRPAGGPGMGGKGGHGPGGRHGHGPMGSGQGAPGTQGAGFSA